MSILKPRWVLLLVLIALLTGAGTTLLNGESPAGAAQTGTVITLVLPDEAHPGELIPVKLVARQARNLAGFQAAVHFNSGSLRGAGIVMEDDLSRTGRQVMPLVPVRGDGVIYLGAATCPVSDCSTSDYAAAPRATQGVDGDVELATLELVASEPGNYPLSLDRLQLVDPQGNQLGAAALNVTLHVVSE